MVGDFAVGKTSLTQQFVNHVFSEQYLTTIGVKIDTKIIDRGEGDQCKLVIWDVAGRDSLTPLQTNYLMGASGFLLVVDGTRRESIDSMKFLIDQAMKQLPNTPFLILFNKHDLADEWLITQEDVKLLETKKWSYLNVSAKTGKNVEIAFAKLVTKMLGEG